MPSLIPPVRVARWALLPVFPRHAQLVEAPRHGAGNRIDRGIGTFANQINRPSREDVAEAVDLGRRMQESDQVRMVSGLLGIPLQRAPDLLPGTLDDLAVRTKGPLDPAHQLEDPLGPHRLGLCVADQRRAQAPVLDARSLGEVDQARELGWLDLSRHGPQA